MLFIVQKNGDKMERITKAFIEKLGIKTEEDIIKIEVSKIFETIESSTKRASNFSQYLEFIRREYGEFIETLYMYLLFRENLYMSDGVYSYLYNIGCLTIYECQEGELQNLELLDLIRDQLCTYLEQSGINTNRLFNHFKSVEVVIDVREYIDYQDDEFETYLQKIEDQGIRFYDTPKHNPIYKIKFMNNGCGEIINSNELVQKNEELKSLLSSGQIDCLFLDEFRNIIRSSFVKKLPNILLFIGSQIDNMDKELITIFDNYHSILFFQSKKNNHILNIIKDLQYELERYLNCDDQNDLMVVVTYDQNIVNYIRHLVYKKEIMLYGNQCWYIDEKNNRHIIPIDETGKFENDYFPPGFFDVTLQELLEMC